MLSRRGLIPCVHDLGKGWPTDWTETLPNTARCLLSAVRREVGQAISANNDWQGVIDSLRPNSHRIWRALPLEEQRRFLRHIRPYWEAHRHRFAPQVQRVLDKLQAENRLSVIAGRVLGSRDKPTGTEVRYRTRTTGDESILQVDRILNCTGPEADFRKLQDPLTRSLMLQGLARADALSLASMWLKTVLCSTPWVFLRELCSPSGRCGKVVCGRPRQYPKSASRQKLSLHIWHTSCKPRCNPENHEQVAPSD